MGEGLMCRTICIETILLSDISCFVYFRFRRAEQEVGRGVEGHAREGQISMPLFCLLLHITSVPAVVMMD